MLAVLALEQAARLASKHKEMSGFRKAGREVFGAMGRLQELGVLGASVYISVF